MIGRGWAKFAALAVLALLLAIGAPAGARAGTSGGQAPAAECRPYPAGEAPSGPRAYLIPTLGKPGDLGRCSVKAFALATHDEGLFRQVYGDDTPIAPSQAIDPVIGRLEDNAYLKSMVRCDETGRSCVLKILIFAHGGRVSQDAATQEAEALAPAMMADKYAPLFLIWNSDDLTTYLDRLCCVTDGEEDRNLVHALVYAPSRLFGDVFASAARAPETYGKQVFRFEESVVDVVKPHPKPNPYLLQADDPGRLCAILKTACPEVDYPRIGDGSDARLLNGLDQPFPERGLGYTAGFPFRVGTTAIAPQIGAAAWDNMVRRTRLALQDGAVDLSALGAKDCGKIDRAADEVFDEGLRDRAPEDRRFIPEGEGAFLIFFDRLACEITARHFKVDFGEGGGAQTVKVELYYFGHSMGALVGNEILARHPELPWRRIVYMAAATPTRDARLMLTTALQACEPEGPDGTLPGVNPWCSSAPGGDNHVNLHFYSLMLHPLAESHDLELGGVVPEGSLLEWIDEMFGGPKTVDDRMFGKWTNAEQTMAMFPPAARRRMTFHVFPAQAKMSDGDAAEKTAFAEQCAVVSLGKDSHGRDIPSPTPERCHPIVHGEFVNYSFWREQYLCGQDACPEADGTAAGP